MNPVAFAVALWRDIQLLMGWRMQRTGHIDREHLAEHIGDPEIAEAIYADAVEHGTLRRILNGELHWPTPEEARIWFRRVQEERRRKEEERRRAEREARPLPGEPGYQGE